MVEFGEQLKRARERRGMTQQSLAEKLYVTRQTVSRWESGARYPDVATLKKISSILNISIDQLLSDGEVIAVVEKTPVTEKPIVNNLLVLLYAWIAILMVSLTIYGFISTPFTWTMIGDGSSHIMLHTLVRDLVEAGFFVFGLIVILKGSFSAKEIGIVTVAFFLMETVTFAGNVFNITDFGQLILIICLVIPYLIGAITAYLFYVGKRNGSAVQILLMLSIVFGIVRQLFSLTTMVMFASSYIDYASIMLAVLRILIYITFIYQSRVLYKRRRSAHEVFGTEMYGKKIGIGVIFIGAIFLAVVLLTMWFKNKTFSMSGGTMIGGADGPTAVFVAAKIGNPWYPLVFICIVVIVIGLILCFSKKKHR